MYKVPVECIVIMNQKKITPLKVRYEIDEERIVVKVARILQRDKKIVMSTMNQPGSIECTFKCEAVQGDSRRAFTLTYNNQTCRWYLHMN